MSILSAFYSNNATLADSLTVKIIQEIISYDRHMNMTTMVVSSISAVYLFYNRFHAHIIDRQILDRGIGGIRYRFDGGISNF